MRAMICAERARAIVGALEACLVGGRDAPRRAESCTVAPPTTSVAKKWRRWTENCTIASASEAALRGGLPTAGTPSEVSNCQLGAATACVASLSALQSLAAPVVTITVRVPPPPSCRSRAPTTHTYRRRKSSVAGLLSIVLPATLWACDGVWAKRIRGGYSKTHSDSVL